MWIYKKNHSGITSASFEDLMRYLNLYINFKLKVLDALEMRLDKDTGYLAEVEKYEDAIKNQGRVSNKSAEYAFIINEYKEAVLMFNISELKIWNKAEEADAQVELEHKWIEALRKKYPVKVNQEQIRKLAKL